MFELFVSFAEIFIRNCNECIYNGLGVLLVEPLLAAAHSSPNYREPSMKQPCKLVFITGTDTGVGKTALGCVLARVLNDRGIDVGVVKPVESGCALKDGRHFPADAAALKEASRSTDDLRMVCPYRYIQPVAPAVAARTEGGETTIAKIASHVRATASTHALTLVEGAGGLLAPTAKDGSAADLARRLKAPVLIAARSSLGTINHSLLTLEAARSRGLVCLGVVLLRRSLHVGLDELENPGEIARLGNCRVFGPLPFLDFEPKTDPSRAAGEWAGELEEIIRVL